MTVKQVLAEMKARNASYPSRALQLMIEWIEAQSCKRSEYFRQYYDKNKAKKKQKAARG